MSNNEVILQGWVSFQGVARLDGKTVVYAHVDTDKPYLGGRHSLVLEGKPAQLALALMEQHGQCVAVQAVVHGRLLTMWRDGQPQSVVAVRYVSFIGEPRTLADGSSTYRPAGRGAA